MREKRKRHKVLKTKAIAKKALKKLSTTDGTKNDVPSSVDSKRSPMSKMQSEKLRKRQKLDSRTPTKAKSASRTKISNDSKKSASKSRNEVTSLRKRDRTR
jgi:hypothetical protein